MADPNYDYKSGKHYKTRAVGQLDIGPLQRDGYDNRVLELTVQEIPFSNSVDADRFIQRQKRIQASKSQLMNQRKMKTMSIASD
jgi:hypothetical protein